MDQFLNLTIGGVASGAVYAVLGMSLVIVFRATRVVNFAQPAFALICAYLADTVATAGGSYWLGFAVAPVAGLVMGVCTERLLIRPARRGGELSVIVVTLGLLLVLQAVAGMVWSTEPRAVPYAFEFRGRFSANDVFVVGTALLVAGAVLLLFKLTPLGLRLRAAAFHPEAALLCGVRVGLTRTVGWGLAAALAAVAGVLATPPFISPNVLDGVFVSAMTAAVIGGLENPLGTVAGGFVLGVGLSYVSGYLGAELVAVAALGILVLTLAVRPAGLFGGPVARSV